MTSTRKKNIGEQERGWQENCSVTRGGRFAPVIAHIVVLQEAYCTRQISITGILLQYGGFGSTTWSSRNLPSTARGTWAQYGSLKSRLKAVSLGQPIACTLTENVGHTVTDNKWDAGDKQVDEMGPRYEYLKDDFIGTNESVYVWAHICPECRGIYWQTRGRANLIMRKKAKPHSESRLHWICPFCGEPCDRFTTLTWCSGCFVEYSPTGMFDDQRKTDRFAFAKALQKSGGTKL